MPTIFDIRTLLITLCLTMASLSFCLGSYSHRRKTYPGFRAWGGAYLLHAAGFLLLGLHEIIPVFFSIVLANSLVISAVFFIYYGFASFTGEKQDHRRHALFILIFSLLLIPFFTYIYPNLSARISLTCFVFAFYFFLATKAYRKTVTTGEIESNTPLLATLISFTVILTLGGLIHLTTLNRVNELMTAGLPLEIILLAITMLFISMAIGFMRLNTQKLERSLTREYDLLAQSREKFQTLAAAAFEGITIIEEGRIIEANDMACEIFGYPRREIIGISPLDLVIPEHRQTVKNNIRTGFGGIYEVSGLRQDGTTFPLEIQGKTFEYKGRKTRVSAVRDNSGRKQMEERLRILSQAMEQSPVSVMITDRAGDLEYVNQKFTEITGYSAEDVLGKKPAILRSGLIAPEVYDVLWQTITAGHEWRGEFHNKRKNGEPYWEYAAINPMRDDKGNISHFLAFKEDITERKELEEELKASEVRFRNLVEYANDFVWEVSTQGIYTYASPMVEKMLGYRPEEIVGKSVFDLIESDEAEREANFFKAKIEKGEPIISHENVNVHKDGRLVTLETSGVPVFDPAGKITHYRGIDRDISKRKEVEAERERLLKELQAAVAEIKTLGGLLPICANCKKIRDDQGYWNNLESYLQQHTDASFSHSICPECYEELYGEEEWYKAAMQKKGDDK
ncbi:MAG: PAS domain-containing protein [Thermodesulfobacteriota bacterium]